MTNTETSTNLTELIGDKIHEDSHVDAVMESFRSGAELVEREERLPTLDRWSQMEMMAQRLARSPLMPDHIRNSRDPEADAMVILLAAHDLGLSATVAFQKLHVVKGRLGQAADLMRALAIREGHQFWCEVEYDSEDRPVGATAYGIRKEFPDRTLSARFTAADAVDAKLATKDTYQQWSEDMYVARASSRLARRDFSDCLSGITYTPDELRVVNTEVEEPPLLASEEDLAAIREAIGSFENAVKAEVRERWKAAKFGSLQPDGRVRQLSAAEVNAAWVLLRAAERETPAEAEIVDEGAPPAPSSATGGGEGQPADDSGAPGVGSLMSASSVAAQPPPENPEMLAPDGAVVSSLTQREVVEVNLPPCEGDAAEPLSGAGNASAGVQTVENIKREVKEMSLLAVQEALKAAGLSAYGTPKQVRDRLTAYVISTRPF